jgi:hypothetical protein
VASSSTSSALPQGDLMEIDTTQTGKVCGPINQKEKQCHCDKNLYLNCGSANRKINDCLNMNEAAKATPTSSGKA